MRGIFCFGNPLHGDDGFGPAVFRRLAGVALPADVRLVEAGTAGLNTLALFQGCRKAVLVDAMAPGEEPGRLRVLTTEEVPMEAAGGHGQGVGYLLRALAALGEPLPGLTVLAAEAAALTPFLPGLSPEVETAVEAAATWIAHWLDE
ncbi:MAG: hydrogenase maturation protease [Sulfuricella sp.]|nr:hydrogenase maturation protease [Sulfuricella sp.]